MHAGPELRMDSSITGMCPRRSQLQTDLQSVPQRVISAVCGNSQRSSPDIDARRTGVPTRHIANKGYLQVHHNTDNRPRMLLALNEPNQEG